MTALVTKKHLTNELQVFRNEIEIKMVTKTEMKKALRDLEKNISSKFDAAVEKIKLYFDATHEHYKKELEAINIDKIRDHDDRITHLEVIARVR